jgi:hypothetical protein
MDPSTLPPVRIDKDVDYNKDNRTDLNEIRAKVAATFGVSSNQVKLELVEGDFQATILPADGDTEIIGKACIEWVDYKDLQKLIPANYSPVDAALNFGAGDGSGPIVFGKLLPTNKAIEKDTVIPRFQAYLAREFQVPADQIELRMETDAKGAPSFSARLKGSDTWRKLEFVIPDPSRPGVNEERDVLVGAFKDQIKATEKPGPLVDGTTPTGTDVPSTGGTTAPKDKASVSEPIALTDLDLTVPTNAKDETLFLAPLPANTPENPHARREALVKDLTMKLGLQPDEAGRIVIKEMGGQLTVAVMPKNAFKESMALLTEPWKPEKIVFLKPASLDDASWLNKEVKQSASNLLIHLGGRSENPNKVDVKLPIPTENGPQWAADRLKETITGIIGGKAQDIILTFNDQGVLQAHKKGSDKVYDVVIRDPYTRDFLLNIARRNPTDRLNTLGESKWQSTADFSVSTGYPNAKGATVFNESLYSRYHFGSWYAGAGVDMKQGLTDFTDMPGHSPFAWQNLRLDVGIPNVIETELRLKNSPDGPKFSLGGVKSNITEDWVKNKFVKDLGKGKTYAVLTTVGVVGAVGTAAVFLAKRDKVTAVDLPLDGTVLDSGKFKMTAGVHGNLLLGGEQHVGYTFKGARMGFTENMAPGTVMNQKLEYQQDYDKTKGGNLLNGQFDGTIAYRTGYSLTTSYNSSTGKFVDSRLGLSQSVALGRGMGLGFNVAGSVNGAGKFHDPALNAGWSYQRGQSWNFRLNVGTSQDANGTWHGAASAGVNLRF